MEIERRKRNLVFTDETFTCRCSVGCSHVAFRASQMPTQRRRRRPADAYWRLCGENYLLLSVSLSLFCPSFFRSSTIRSAATPAIWLRTFVVFGSWVPDATAVQVLRSFGPDLSLNAERSYQHLEYRAVPSDVSDCCAWSSFTAVLIIFLVRSFVGRYCFLLFPSFLRVFRVGDKRSSRLCALSLGLCFVRGFLSVVTDLSATVSRLVIFFFSLVFFWRLGWFFVGIKGSCRVLM